MNDDIKKEELQEETKNTQEPEVKEEKTKTSTTKQESEIETAEENQENTENKEESEEKEESNEDKEDFEKMLDESLVNTQDADVGDEITGEIIKITNEYIFISLGGKMDAFAEKKEYFDKEGNLPYEIGDEITGYVISKSDEETVISKSFNKAYSSKAILKDAYEKKIPVNGKVTSAIKGGFSVDLLGIRAFCPVSHLDIKRVVDSSEYIGRTFDFEVIEYSNRGRNIVVSRKTLLKKAQAEKRKETMEKVEVGAELEGEVTRITTYGAFVDLGGVEGLLHISELSWKRVETPTEIINLHDKIKVKVIKINGKRISLSLKALEPHPFDIATSELNVGDKITGKIVKNQPFGSFIEIRPGVEGLIPISEMARGRRIIHPSDILDVGEEVEAEVIKVNPEKRKISLSLKALQPDPWDNVDNHIKVDNDYLGEIENVTNFGAFIHLAGGLVGLLPKSKFKRAGIQLSKDDIGEKIEVRVTNIDKENQRIALIPVTKDKEKMKELTKDNWRRYAKERNRIPDDNPFKDL